MPVLTLDESAVTTPPGYPHRKRWTRIECEALESAGMWNTEKLELIEGDLIDRTGKNSPHVDAMMLVLEWLAAVFGMRYIRPEAPIDVAPEDNPTSKPEPDLTVLRQPRSSYGGANPKAEDIRLLVEISDTTLAFDLGIKARIYARAQFHSCECKTPPARGLHGLAASVLTDEKLFSSRRLLRVRRLPAAP